MTHRKPSFSIKVVQSIIVILLLLPLTANASFIEATVGTAVVDDATATYYNPASLTQIKKLQLVAQGSFADLHTQFTGQATQTRTGLTLSGTTNRETNYYLPSIYLGIPTTKNIFFGVAMLSNLFNSDTDPASVLRYAQGNNKVQDLDLIPAIGIKINDVLSLGAGLNFSRADFLLEPITGIPSLNIPDSQSHNESSGNACGGDVGLLLKPTPSTLIGFNYRSSMTYHLSGKSILEGNPGITSDHYSFDFWTPARYVLSVNQFVTKKLGFIGTVQWVQWDIFDKVNVHGLATQIGPQPIILQNASIPYHLHNAWIFTVGNNYRVTPKWVIRAAGSYLPSPGNANYQISTGDNLILGASTGYEISKHISIDGSYAHAFIKNQNINIANPINTIIGVNKASRDSVSLKLTFNA